jgi:two-component system chemotaxis response regulator CheY
MFLTSIKILVLDDMPTIRDLVKKQLRDMGYKNIISGEDGVIGWQLINDAIDAGAPFDLIISDWMMPNMKGLEVLKLVRAHPKIAKTPFILLTSESERDQVTEAVLAGVSNYIVKPFSPKGFEEKLRAVWKKINGIK